MAIEKKIISQYQETHPITGETYTVSVYEPALPKDLKDTINRRKDALGNITEDDYSDTTSEYESFYSDEMYHVDTISIDSLLPEEED